RVASWHNAHIWDLLKNAVVDEETALRLSKVLRDNHHTVMAMLGRFLSRGHYLFLSTLLNIQFANFSPEFENLRVENYVTRFDQMLLRPRDTLFAEIQKLRRLRVAVETLNQYLSK